MNSGTTFWNTARHLACLVLALALCAAPTCAVPALADAPAAKSGVLVIDGDVIISQEMEENYCALTFDDGPSIYTPHLLDMLAAYGIPATFFMVGRNAEHFPHLVRRIEAEGHEVANHSYSHPNLRKLPYERKRAEIANTNAILRNIGVTPRFMRPPYGAFDDSTENIAKELGLSIVLWSVDSKDWKRLPANYGTLPTTQGFVYPQGEMRGVFLFHDIHQRTVNDLPRIVTQLRAAGCQRFVTMSEYMDKMDHSGLRMARSTRPAPSGYLTDEQLIAAQSVYPLPVAMTDDATQTAQATPLPAPIVPVAPDGGMPATDAGAPAATAASEQAAAPTPPPAALPAHKLAPAPFWPAGSTPVPLARCSKPSKSGPAHASAKPDTAETASTPASAPTPTPGPAVAPEQQDTPAHAGRSQTSRISQTGQAPASPDTPQLPVQENAAPREAPTAPPAQPQTTASPDTVQTAG